MCCRVDCILVLKYSVYAFFAFSRFWILSWHEISHTLDETGGRVGVPDGSGHPGNKLKADPAGPDQLELFLNPPRNSKC